MYTTKQFVNSSETTISFSLSYHDWCLLQESVLWKHLDKYLDACQSADTQERAKILESEVRKTAEVVIRKIDGRTFLQIGYEQIEISDYTVKSSAAGITELNITICGNANIFELSAKLKEGELGDDNSGDERTG